MAKTLAHLAPATLLVVPLVVSLAGCPAFVHDDYEFGAGAGEGEGEEDCAEDEIVFEQRCYFVTESPDDYDASLAACEDRGSGWGLVEIGSPEENDFVSSLVDRSEAWLGATDRESEGDWVWNSGAPLWEGDQTGTCLSQFCRWDLLEPNDTGDCARIVGDLWRDSPCDEQHPAVCEGPG